MSPGSRFRSVRANVAEKLVLQRGSMPCIFLLFVATVVIGFLFVISSSGPIGNRNKFARLMRPCFLSNYQCKMDNIRAEMLDLPDIVQYVEWANRSSCALVQDFGGKMMSAGDKAGLDGQKAVCLDPPQLAPPVNRCVVYSFGINDEWSFDEAMASYGCRVFSFDPKGQQQHNRTDKIHFFRWALGSESILASNDTDVPTKTLDEIYRDLSGWHGQDVVIDYLKMDIEWAEWRVLPQIIQSGMLDKVRQLAVEIHLPFTAPYFNAGQGLDQFRRLFSIIRSVETYGMVRFDSKRNIFFQNGIPSLNYTGPMAYELAWYNARFLY